MANYNRVTLIGRLTRDPELRHTQGGTAVTEIALAINREFTTQDGTRRKEVCFVDVVFWARKAEIVTEFCKTGTTLFVDGRLELDQWQSPDGQKRSRLRVVSEQFQFLDKGPKNGNGDNSESPEESAAEGDQDVSWDEAAAGVPEPEKDAAE